MIELREPSDHLFREVVARIREEEQLRVVRRKFFGFSLALVGSAAVLLPFLRMSVDALARSGFSAYASLLFSDGGIVLSQWKDLGYSLLESLPVLALIGFLGSAVIFLQSLQFVVKEFKRVTASLTFA